MDKRTLQGIISIAALFCIVVGWFNLFSPEINSFLSNRLFYILIGISFVLLALMFPNPSKRNKMFLAAALCILGALLPLDSPYSKIKTIGLLVGVVLSFMARPRR